VPGAACLVNAICTNCILKRENWKFICYLTAFYGVILWVYYLLTGVQQYSFLDFASTDALKNLFIINLGAVIVYLGFCVVDEKIKPINDATSIYTYSGFDKKNEMKNFA